MNYLSLQAPIGKSAQVYVDGKRAAFSDLNEGDVVRAAFDAKGPSFSGIAAVTPMRGRGSVGVFVLRRPGVLVFVSLKGRVEPLGVTRGEWAAVRLCEWKQSLAGRDGNHPEPGLRGPRRSSCAGASAIADLRVHKGFLIRIDETRAGRKGTV